MEVNTKMEITAIITSASGWNDNTAYIISAMNSAKTDRSIMHWNSYQCSSVLEEMKNKLKIIHLIKYYNKKEIITCKQWMN